MSTSYDNPLSHRYSRYLHDLHRHNWAYQSCNSRVPGRTKEERAEVREWLGTPPVRATEVDKEELAALAEFVDMEDLDDADAAVEDDGGPLEDTADSEGQSEC